MNEYQKAILILEAACAAYAKRLATSVVEHEDEIATQAIGGESSFCTDQMTEIAEKLREHALALCELTDFEPVWSQEHRVVVVTADTNGVVSEEHE